MAELTESKPKILGKRTRKVAFGGEEKTIQVRSSPDKIYEFKNGLRYVISYDNEFKAFAKRRWVVQ